MNRHLAHGALCFWLIAAGQLASSRTAAAAPVPHPTALEVKTQVKEVYGRPEFLPDSTPDPFRWLWLRVQRFFRWLTTIYDTQPLLYWTLLVLCVAALAALLAHI